MSINTRFGPIKIADVFYNETEAIVNGYAELFVVDKNRKVFSKAKGFGFAYALLLKDH